MAPSDDQSSHRTHSPEAQSSEVAQAIQGLAATTREAATSLTYAIQDAATNLNESVRSAATAVLAAFVKQSPTAKANDHWPDTNAPFARANGGRQLRPLSEKTNEEKASLDRMRARKERDSK
jgi:hypothetical protein